MLQLLVRLLQLVRARLDTSVKLIIPSAQLALAFLQLIQQMIEVTRDASNLVRSIDVPFSILAIVSVVCSSGLKIFLAHFRNSGTVAITAMRNAATIPSTVWRFASVKGRWRNPAYSIPTRRP
jgi:hypothetical protein